jgi:hypothetical protein
MEDLDLDIQNYELQDILNLFKISYNFTKDDLKQSYKMYLKTHPDKSGLDSKFFLFFEKAYDVLERIHFFRNKKTETDDSYESSTPDQENAPSDKEKVKLLQFLDGKSVTDFNEWFNDMFNKTKVTDDENDSGYGEWYNNYEDKAIEEVAYSEFGRIFEKKKKETCRDLVIKRELSEMSDTGGFNLDREKPEEYSSNIFSKLPFEDLKKAHTETVIPVFRKDFDNVRKFNDIEHYKNYRHKQDITPLSAKHSKEYLKNKENASQENDTQRIFNIIKRDEEVGEINKKWWGYLKRLQ